MNKLGFLRCAYSTMYGDSEIVKYPGKSQARNVNFTSSYLLRKEPDSINQ